MEFKKLIEEQNRLECLKTRGEITDYGLEMLEELNQALQSLQSCVIKSVCNYYISGMDTSCKCINCGKNKWEH